MPLVHRTARIRLRVTRHQADRCYGLMRSPGDLWAWLLDTNRERLEQGAAPIVGYQALPRQLTARGPAGELSAVEARSVLLVLGRAIRAESFLHLRDQQTRQAKTARRAPKPGQHGSRRWRRYRASGQRIESRRRRVHQAHHQAASQVADFAVRHRIGVLVVGDPTGITAQETGRVHNLRLRQCRRTHLLQALRDKAERAGIDVRLVDERGTSSSTCPACRRRVPKPSGRRFRCHLHDQRRRGRSCLASGHPDGHQGSSGCRSSYANHRPCVRRGSSTQARQGQHCLKGH